MNQGVVKQNSCSTELQRIITASCNEFAAVTLEFHYSHFRLNYSPLFWNNSGM